LSFITQASPIGADLYIYIEFVKPKFGGWVVGVLKATVKNESYSPKI